MEKMNEGEFRNYMAGDPYLSHHAGVYPRKKQKDFCACGLNATGGTDVEIPEPENNVKTKVMNLKVMGYAKTALALVGAYIIGTWLYKKYVK